MKSFVLELPYDPPSQNVWERTNRFAKKKLMLRYRDAVLMLARDPHGHPAGEGPYRKTMLAQKTNKAIREQVVAELRKTWPKKRKAYVDITVRRPKRFDRGNHIGGCKPLLDAIQWAGWCVTDHCNWLVDIYRDQVIGDEKTIVEFFLPETDEDEELLERKFKV